ncbi:MAG: radical SAM family heme chaperone HemW [Caldimicrobium sp.]
MFILKEVDLALYIHIPFCKRKCPYCDFFSLPKLPKESLYLRAILKEIKLLPKFLENRKLSTPLVIKTVYVGGGTPSLMSPSFYAVLFEEISKIFKFEPEEITLEANPESFTEDLAKGYKKVGINRISLGVQTFQEKGLHFLKRAHSVKEIYLALEHLYLAQFSNFSLDFIFGWSGQGLKTLEKDLAKISEINPPHLSFYELTIYPGTAFHKLYGEKPSFVQENRLLKLAKFIRYYLKRQGYIHYELSNYAKPGYECKHNLYYWKGKNYLGIGTGAVSRIGNIRFQSVKNLDHYYRALLKENRLPYIILEKLDSFNECKEKIFMGLRLREGLDISELSTLGYTIEEDTINYLIKRKLLEKQKKRIYLSEKGSFLHNQVVKFLWRFLKKVS